MGRSHEKDTGLGKNGNSLGPRNAKKKCRPELTCEERGKDRLREWGRKIPKY